MAFQPQTRGICRAGQESKVLEAWLHQSLARRFDSTLSEPLPNDLLALLREH